MASLRHPRLWLVIGWILILLAVIVCLIPMQHVPQPPGVTDKMEHATAYAALSLWFAGIYPRSRYLVIAACLFAMGVLIEFLQGAMHVGRHADARDVVANCIGIAAGLALAFTWLGNWAQWLERLAPRAEDRTDEP